jgi:hypothetical protein
MLSTEFQRKVRMIPESQLSKYLAPGYTKFLPDEMASGLAPSDAIVQDFIEYRAYVEKVDLPSQMDVVPDECRNSASHTQESTRVMESEQECTSKTKHGFFRGRLFPRSTRARPNGMPQLVGPRAA